MAQPTFASLTSRSTTSSIAVHGVGHGGGDRGGQAHSLVDVVDLASDDDGVRRRPAECGEAGEHRGGIHRVRVETDARGERFMVGLEDVQGAGRPAVGEGVDEHQRVASVEQVVGQVHAADSVVHHPHSRTRDVFGHMAHHLGAEAVVAEEDVADTGYQNLGRDSTSQSPTCAGSSGIAARSGIERTPITTAPSTTTPAMTVAVTPTACMSDSFHSTVRPHRVRSTGSGRTTRAGRRPDHPR